MNEITPRVTLVRFAVCSFALFTLVALSAVGPARRAEAVTFTVNSANDVDDGTCNGAHCSLREAINATNANGTGSDLIYFSIGSGLQRAKRARSFAPSC